MLTLLTKVRQASDVRKEGMIPAVLYGSQIESLSLKLDLKEFEKVYKEAGKNTLVELKIEGGNKEFLVLIYQVQFDVISGQPIHIDFFQPSLKEKTEAKVPLVFEGESLAVSDLDGTLVKNIFELEIKALPQDFPKEIKVNIDRLKTFDDEVLVKDLEIPENVEVLRKPDEVVATVSRPEKVEEELEKPIEEKVEEVEKVGEEEEIKEKEDKKEDKEEKESTEKSK
jgi:large subunit ribosomal protein L25